MISDKETFREGNERARAFNIKEKLPPHSRRTNANYNVSWLAKHKIFWTTYTYIGTWLAQRIFEFVSRLSIINGS